MATHTYEEDDVIDLLEVFHVLLQKFLVILLVSSLFCAASFGFTVFFVEPSYEATASMYVNNSSFSFGDASFSISSSEITASKSLTSTYVYILQTRETMEEVMKQTGLSYTYDEIMKKKMIKAEEVNGTAIFEVTVTSSSPTEAELIANTIVKVLPDRIVEIVDGSDVRTVSYAIVPAHRSSPSYTNNLLLGFLFGAVLSSAIVLVKYFVSKSTNVLISSADDLRKRYPDITILSLIPDMRLASKKGYYYSSYYGSKQEKR